MVIIGSARHDEKGKITGGAAGDQLQTGVDDFKGEVSMQNFYVHSKGWYILRPKSAIHAQSLGSAMRTACNNSNLGYDQNNRLGIIKYGINSTVRTECDCGTTVRACIKHAIGIDPGNFTTADEVKVLMATGLFEKLTYKKGMALYTGDILVTKRKGHTVIVTSGDTRIAASGAVSFGSFTYEGVDYSPVFDPAFYLSSYSDLGAAGLSTAQALFNHFIQHGMNEKRQASKEFNVSVYMRNYDDLRQAFGGNIPLYYRHYCTNGKAENRKAI